MKEICFQQKEQNQKKYITFKALISKQKLTKMAQSYQITSAVL